MSVPTTTHTDPNPFPYGWRYVTRTRPDGTAEVDMVPLTLLDVLHPQEGDQIPEDSRHERHRRHFQNVFETRLAPQANLLCLSDCLIDWDREVRGHSPDLIVLERDGPWPWGSWGTLHVKQEGARPRLVVELTSPSTRGNDVGSKVEHYHRVGVPLYVIVDEEEEEGPLTLIGYRWQPKGYEVLPLDPAGRLLLEPFGVLLAIKGDRVAILDAATGQEIGDYGAITRALEAEVRAREAAEQRAREQAQVRKEAEHARAAAEQREREQAQAREAAERSRAEAEQARAEAEHRAQEQAQATLAMEDRLKELEAQLQRLRGPSP